MDGLPLTFCMIPLKDNVGTRDAAVARRMREAGGLFLGKTNSPESGYYGGTDNHLFGPRTTPGRRGSPRAARAVERLPRWPPASVRWPRAATAPDRCESRPR